MSLRSRNMAGQAERRSLSASVSALPRLLLSLPAPSPQIRSAIFARLAVETMRSGGRTARCVQSLGRVGDRSQDCQNLKEKNMKKMSKSNYVRTYLCSLILG